MEIILKCDVIFVDILASKQRNLKETKDISLGHIVMKYSLKREVISVKSDKLAVYLSSDRNFQNALYGCLMHGLINVTEKIYSNSKCTVADLDDLMGTGAAFKSIVFTILHHRNCSHIPLCPVSCKETHSSSSCLQLQPFIAHKKLTSWSKMADRPQVEDGVLRGINIQCLCQY